MADYAANAKNFYETLLGPYPFSRLAVTAIDDEASAGIGPQANIFIPESLWRIPGQHPMASLVPEVVSHEIGHQYFFNLIGVTDQPEAWMSEAFAEYVATRASEDRTGSSAHLRRNYWTYIYEVPGNDDVGLWGVAVRESRYYFPIVYQKGSAVLGVLRTRLGGEAFDTMLRDYVSAFAGATTTTAEFRDFVVENVDVDWASKFFDDWVYRPGYPDLTVTAKRGRNDDEPLVITIRQQPTKGAAFDGPLPIRLRGPAPPVDQAIALQNGDYEIELGDHQWLEIDPELSLFRRIRPEPVGDVNFNGVVDGMDLLDANAALRTDSEDEAWSDHLDTNDDRRIDQQDLVKIIEQFGQGW